MNISLTEEHLMIAKAAQDFAQKEVYPKIKEQDIKEQCDPSIIKKMGSLGFFGLCVPKEYGGQGTDYLSLGLTSLEFEKVDASLRFIILTHLALNSLTILKWGTPEQKEKYLIPQVKGEKIATFAMAEPNAGSDLLGIKASAKKDSDYYILNGEKTWISLADVADSFLIFAYTDESQKHKGISAFIVEKNSPGVSTSTIHGKLGVRAGNTGSISLEDVKVPKENLLGKEGSGLEIGLSALNNGLYTVAAGAVGVIEACLEASVKYARVREAFGVEIGRHQLVQEMIAKMSSAKDIGRLLIYNLAYLKDNLKPSVRETFLAKWVNCNSAFECANDALQIFGAYGYSNEFNIERYWRNARGALIYGLTREIHTTLQAEHVLKYSHFFTA